MSTKNTPQENDLVWYHFVERRTDVKSSRMKGNIRVKIKSVKMKCPIFNLKYTLLFNTFFFCLRCIYHKCGIVCKYCWKGPWISSSSLILGMFVRSQSKLQNNSEDQILFFNKRVIRKLKRDHFSWRPHRGWIVLSLRYFHYQSLTSWSW